MPKTIIEPFRIKMVEPIQMTIKSERIKLLEKAHNNNVLALIFSRNIKTKLPFLA